MSGYRPTPSTPEKKPPTTRPYQRWTPKAKDEKAACCLPTAQLRPTMTVVMTAMPSTV